MSQERTIGLNHQISEEAAEWLVEFRTGPVSTGVRKEFDAWVRASPEHLRAFIEMALLWRESGALDPQRRLDVEELIERDRRDSKLVELTSHRATSEGAVLLSRTGRDVPPRTNRTDARQPGGPSAGCPERDGWQLRQVSSARWSEDRCSWSRFSQAGPTVRMSVNGGR